MAYVDLNEQDKVLQMLQDIPATRNSDKVLFTEMVWQQAKENGDPEAETIRRVLMKVMVMGRFCGFPNYESVTRIRRKIQEQRQDLQAAEDIKEFRKERECSFERYGLDLEP